MNRLLPIIVAICAVGLVATGCKLKEMFAEQAEQAIGEELGIEEGADCEGFESCCNELNEMLSGLEGVPEATTGAIQTSCDSIEKIKDAPGSDLACGKAMMAMLDNLSSLESIPGFELPEPCDI